MVDSRNLRALKIGDIEIPVPIVQGALGAGISTAPLVSRVSDEGGLGVIASVGLGVVYGIDNGVSLKEIYKNFAKRNSDALREEILRIREITDAPFAVNIMSVLTDYDTLAKVCDEEKVDVIISGAGLPIKLPQYITNDHTKLVPLVSSGRVANLILKRWDKRFGRTADAVIIESPFSGGHQGFSFEEIQSANSNILENLISDTKESVKIYEDKYDHEIPVIATGGIYSGMDVGRHLDYGASGVQIGSRFILTEECDVSPNYKAAHMSARERDIDLILSPLGLPVRVVKNEFYWKLQRGEVMDFNCGYHCLSACKANKANFCIAEALISARKGDMENGLVLCSTITPRSNRIYSVKELMTELVDEASRYFEEKLMKLEFGIHFAVKQRFKQI